MWQLITGKSVLINSSFYSTHVLNHSNRPKNKCMFHNSFTWLILTSVRKTIHYYIKYYTAYNKYYVGLSNAKILTLLGGLQCKDASSFLPLLPHAENQLLRFPQVFGPTPSPDPTPQHHTPTHMIQFQVGRRWHRHIGNILGQIQYILYVYSLWPLARV